MGRFNAQDADNYGGSGNSTGFFKLSNDGDVARVRFMYNSADDVEGVACHEVEVNGKKRYVNCLREYNQPLSDCPFCANNKFQVAKLFVPVYDIDEDKVKIWERGKKFFGKLSSICARYPNTVSHTFEVERHGKQGDTSTTYEIYETGNDGTKLEDLPELPQIIGGIVLDKSADEMKYYLDYGEFPENSNSSSGNTTRRRDEVPWDNTPTRRTPANNRRGDAF